MSRPPAILNPGLIARGLPTASTDVPTLYLDKKTGKYVVNGNKSDVQWRWRSAAAQQVYAVPLPASGAVVDAVIDFSAQGGGTGDSEVQHFWGNTVSGRRFAVQPQLRTPTNQYLSNVPISSNLVFGTSQLPGYLSSPLRCWANTDLRFNAESLSGLDEVVNLGAFCRAYDDSGCEEAGDCRRRAWLEEMRCFLTGWLGPQDKVNEDLTGPEITIPAATSGGGGGGSVITFDSQPGVNYVVNTITDDSHLTLTTPYTGPTTSANIQIVGGGFISGDALVTNGSANIVGEFGTKFTTQLTAGGGSSVVTAQTVEIRFPAPTDADFLAACILDDSTSTTGMEPQLTAILMEEDTRETLTDFPQGISWRDFIACPTVTVTGFPSGGVIRAMSLQTPRGGWTHQIRRTSALVLKITSTDPGVVTLRTALHGWTVGCAEPSDRRYAPSVNRTTSMPGAGVGLGGGVA